MAGITILVASITFLLYLVEVVKGSTYCYSSSLDQSVFCYNGCCSTYLLNPCCSWSYTTTERYNSYNSYNYYNDYYDYESGISSGGVAAIVIGCLISFGTVIVIIVCVVLSRRQPVVQYGGQVMSPTVTYVSTNANLQPNVQSHGNQSSSRIPQDQRSNHNGFNNTTNHTSPRRSPNPNRSHDRSQWQADQNPLPPSYSSVMLNQTSTQSTGSFNAPYPAQLQLDTFSPTDVSTQENRSATQDYSSSVPHSGGSEHYYGKVSDHPNPSAPVFE